MSRSRFTLSALAAMLLAVPSLQAVELQSVAGTDTKLRVYGFVHVYANYFIDGDQQVGAGNKLIGSSLFYSDLTNQSGNPSKTLRFDYAPTRLGFASTTPSASLGDITTKLEFDFNGTNYPHTRLAQIGIGNWTFGQQWSLWVDGDAGADTVDWAGTIGGASYDTPRFVAVNYTAKLDKNNTVGVAIEENSGLNDGNVGATHKTDVGKGKLPTFVGAYTYSADWGHVGLRALAQNYSVAVAGTATSDPTDFSKVGSAFQASGQFNIAKDSLIATIYTGSGLGQYGTGIQDISVDQTTRTITLIKSTGWVAGYTHNWTDAVRSNLILSGVSFSSDSAIAGTDGTTGTLAKSFTYGTVNTFVKLAKNTELGFEYVYEGAKAFGSSDVWADKNDKATNKQNASKIEVSLHVGF